jgi:cation transport ATPase
MKEGEKLIRLVEQQPEVVERKHQHDFSQFQGIYQGQTKTRKSRERKREPSFGKRTETSQRTTSQGGRDQEEKRVRSGDRKSRTRKELNSSIILFLFISFLSFHSFHFIPFFSFHSSPYLLFLSFISSILSLPFYAFFFSSTVNLFCSL